MSSVIFRAAARLLEPFMLLYAVFLIFSGHNEPGGGFSAGLTAGGVFVLHVIAFGLASARRMLVVAPQTLLGGGLLLALASGLVATLSGKPFMTGVWTHVHLPLLGEFGVGTPVFFDIGVFLVVVGVISAIVSVLTEVQDLPASQKPLPIDMPEEQP
jgi:multicomponent Na+:H+ antiporter subunit B